MTLTSQEQAMKDAAEKATPGDLDTVANPAAVLELLATVEALEGGAGCAGARPCL